MSEQLKQSSPTVTDVDFDDIQALVRFGHGKLSDACFLLLRLQDRGAAADWLKEVPVASAQWLQTPPDTALQIAFTASGLVELGLEEGIMRGFSEEFLTGMSGDQSRSRRLGDVADNAPGKWQWGSSETIHLVLLLYARPGRMPAFRQQLEDQRFRQAFELIQQLDTSDTGGLEHFGFVDGISQPEIDWQRQLATDFHSRESYSNQLSIGEILLGYPNEYGEYSRRPLKAVSSNGVAILPRAEEQPDLEDFGRNGSYLVMRQLSQDVPAFWQYLNQQTHGNEQQREQLAAAMVGRKRDGSPLVDSTDLNSFDFDSDPHGHGCPIGSHVRRSNPRTGDFPAGVSGFWSRLVRIFGFGRQYPGDDLVASTRFHRLLRRGRPYGKMVSVEQAIDGEGGEQQRGLHFVCLVANISRQFEFVQNAWNIGPKFSGLVDEGDPLLGNRQPLKSGARTDHFSRSDPRGPVHCSHNLPQFIRMQGGAYFFMPGIRALRYIAQVAAGDGEGD